MPELTTHAINSARARLHDHWPVVYQQSQDIADMTSVKDDLVILNQARRADRKVTMADYSLMCALTSAMYYKQEKLDQARTWALNGLNESKTAGDSRALAINAGRLAIIERWHGTPAQMRKICSDAISHSGPRDKGSYAHLWSLLAVAMAMSGDRSGVRRAEGNAAREASHLDDSKPASLWDWHPTQAIQLKAIVMTETDHPQAVQQHDQAIRLIPQQSAHLRNLARLDRAIAVAGQDCDHAVQTALDVIGNSRKDAVPIYADRGRRLLKRLPRSYGKCEKHRLAEIVGIA